MDRKEFEAKQIKVDGARGIAITTAHIHPQYSLQYSPDVGATATAHIVLFSLVPNAPGLPTFRGRWDDKAGSVDVDLDGPTRQRLAFKYGLAGYAGHHTTLLSASPRKHGIHIRIPGDHIFQGEITLGVNIAAKFEETMSLNADVTFSVSVVKPSLIRRIVRCLRKLF